MLRDRTEYSGRRPSFNRKIISAGGSFFFNDDLYFICIRQPVVVSNVGNYFFCTSVKVAIPGSSLARYLSDFYFYAEI